MKKTIAAVALGASAIAGTAVALDYKADRDSALVELQDVTQERDEAVAQIGDLPEREEALERAKAQFDEDLDEIETTFNAEVEAITSDLDRRERRIARLERSLDKRERAVGIVEAAIARASFGGNGVYEVGRDIKPGSYSSGGAQCYWAVLGDPNGANIINNHYSSGPTLVTLSEGQFFETQSCREWKPRS